MSEVFLKLNIPLCTHTHFVCLSICGRTRLAFVNTGVRGLFADPPAVPGVEVLGQKTTTFTFLRNRRTRFPHCLYILHFHQRCTSDLIASFGNTYFFLFFCFLVIAILLDMKGCLTVVSMNFLYSTYLILIEHFEV